MRVILTKLGGIYFNDLDEYVSFTGFSSTPFPYCGAIGIQLVPIAKLLSGALNFLNHAIYPLAGASNWVCDHVTGVIVQGRYSKDPSVLA